MAACLACLLLWVGLALGTFQPPLAKLGGLPSPSEADLMLLREEAIPTDGAGLEDWIRQRVLGDEELARMGRLVEQLGDEEFQKREEATKTLTSYGTRARSALRKGMENKDPEVRARSVDALRQIEISHTPLIQGAALRTLGRLQKGKASKTDATLLGFMRPKENFVLLESAMDGLSFLASEWTEPSPAVLDALQKRTPPERYTILLALIKSGKPFGVELAKAQVALPDPEAKAWGSMALCFSGADPSYFGTLIENMNQLDSGTFALAEDIGYRLGEPSTPEPFPVLSGGDREKRIALWKTWWESRQGQPLVLRDPLVPGGPGGSTMVMMLDLGRIVDLDLAKKPRWQINELEFPLDAQLLPGPRVLVAEHYGARVTERDVKGRILWAKGYAEPLAAQRLASGVTLITSAEGFTEVDLNGQEIVTWSPKTDERIMKIQRRFDGFTAVVLTTADMDSSRVAWLDRSFRERATFPVQVRKSGGRIDILPGNQVILPEFENNRIAQFDITGKVVWKAELDQPVSCVVTPAGTIMANCGSNRGAVELDRSGKEIWGYQTDTRVTRAWRR